MDQPKIVLFNDLTACRQKSGVGCYASQLLRHLESSDSEIRVLPLSRTLLGTPLQAANRVYDRARTVGGSDSAEPGWTAKWRKRITAWIRKHGHAALDHYVRTASKLGDWQLYHEPDAIPLSVPAPTISTIHDLSVLLFPKWHPKHRVEKYEKHLRDGLQRTTQFLAVSQSTRRDMIEHLGLQPDRIHVVPEAPRPEFRPLSKEQIQPVLRRLNLPAQFLLYVGTIEPRKNVVGMLRAYGRLAGSLRAKYPLVLVGGWGWGSETVRAMLSRSPWNESVYWTGYLEDDELVAVMNAATALIYPSFYEGFGLPPLEAMACDTPVITTHSGSLAEVVEDAAIVVDPHDEDDLAVALKAVVVHREVVEEYRQRGRRQVAKFNWQATANATRDVYRKVA